MKKIIKRTVAGIVLTAIIIISGLATLVFFPQSLFAHKMEYKKFHVYADSEIQKDIQKILDDAYTLTSHCELHDPDFQFNIFLSYENTLNRIDDLQGKGPIARATAGNIIIKVPIDVKSNRICGARGCANLTEILAHEMVHNLQANKYGLLSFSPIKHPPLWKLEGYPEYVSRQSMLTSNDYNLVSEIKRYIVLDENSENGFVEVTKDHFMPAYYYKGRLMVEYLMNAKRLTYDQILEDTRIEEEVFNEMLDWAGKKSKLIGF